jgi:murein DD-endopeptidase MepM/ murein hydrolase activator NlpD
MLAVLLQFLFSSATVSTTAGAKASEADRDTVLKGKQGDILYFALPLEGQPVSVTGIFHDRRIPFFQTTNGVFAALLGIDMADTVETDDLRAEITYAEGVRHRVFKIAVAPEDFREQRMTLPKEMVDPDAAALVRIEREREKVRHILAGMTPERLWSKPFVVPVDGIQTGAFGSRRILNGQPRNQHSGEDIAAELGTPVKVTNAGIVRMVDDHYFSGLGVIVDHGLGLYTMYFHLNSAAVKEGERLERGQNLGTVGKSGRASGPHLHWGAWLNGSRVNPFALTKLPIEP